VITATSAESGRPDRSPSFPVGPGECPSSTVGPPSPTFMMRCPLLGEPAIGTCRPLADARKLDRVYKPLTRTRHDGSYAGNLPQVGRTGCRPRQRWCAPTVTCRPAVAFASDRVLPPPGCPDGPRAPLAAVYVTGADPRSPRTSRRSLEGMAARRRPATSPSGTSSAVMA
jgi:hypothetical protein